MDVSPLLARNSFAVDTNYGCLVRHRVRTLSEFKLFGSGVIHFYDGIKVFPLYFEDNMECCNAENTQTEVGKERVA